MCGGGGGGGAMSKRITKNFITASGRHAHSMPSYLELEIKFLEATHKKGRD